LKAVHPETDKDLLSADNRKSLLHEAHGIWEGNFRQRTRGGGEVMLSASPVWGDALVNEPPKLFPPPTVEQEAAATGELTGS